MPKAKWSQKILCVVIILALQAFLTALDIWT